MKMPRNTSVETRAAGNITTYAPRTPAMAPDAPTIGSGCTSPWPIAATIPQSM